MVGGCGLACSDALQPEEESEEGGKDLDLIYKEFVIERFENRSN